MTKHITGADIGRILEMIPQRYPFLMVDRVIDMVAGASAVGIKNVTINEPHFQGHFPHAPVMPGVLIIESMAQTAAILFVETYGPAAAGKMFCFMAIEDARFRAPVRPGDTMVVDVRKRRSTGTVWQVTCRAMVGERLVAEATLRGAILPHAE